jgi:hypothetical protein
MVTLAAVDSFNISVIKWHAEKLSELEETANEALRPAENPFNHKLSDEFKAWVAKYDHIENSLSAAHSFCSRFLVTPSLAGTWLLMIYGNNFIQVVVKIQ